MRFKKYLTIVFFVVMTAVVTSCAQTSPDEYLLTSTYDMYADEQDDPAVYSQEYQPEYLPDIEPDVSEKAEYSENNIDEHLCEYLSEYSEIYPEEEQLQSPFYHIPHGYLSESFLIYLNDDLPNRVSFSYREYETALWIVRQLELMGYERENIEIQEFTVAAANLSSRARNPLHFFSTGTAELRNTSQNVILTIPGQTERKIIVGAHYDSFYYPAASDNASGTAVLLESAARMRYLENYFTIIYIFFGAEEVGLIGSYYYLYSLTNEERENIVLMISADCLFDGSVMVYAAAYNAAGQFGANALTRQIDEVANYVIYQNNFELAASPRGVLIVSDHMPFYNEGFTVLVLFSADVVDGRFRMRVFHSYRDCIHYINNRWPGRIQASLHTFSAFLEGVLLMESD